MEQFRHRKNLPKDLDILLITSEGFEAGRISASSPSRFDSTRASSLSDVFRARASMAQELLHLLAGNLSKSQHLSLTRYCGTGAAMIQTDDQMLLAQQCVGNLRSILLEARNAHSRQDYTRTAEPILLEIQQRAQEMLEYLSRQTPAAASNVSNLIQ